MNNVKKGCRIGNEVCTSLIQNAAAISREMRSAGGEGTVCASNFVVYNGMDCFVVIYLVESL